MGEVVFSIFIGLCLVAVGLIMNWVLAREQRALEQSKTRRQG